MGWGDCRVLILDDKNQSRTCPFLLCDYTDRAAQVDTNSGGCCCSDYLKHLLDTHYDNSACPRCHLYLHLYLPPPCFSCRSDSCYLWSQMGKPQRCQAQQAGAAEHWYPPSILPSTSSATRPLWSREFYRPKSAGPEATGTQTRVTFLDLKYLRL